MKSIKICNKYLQSHSYQLLFQSLHLQNQQKSIQYWIEYNIKQRKGQVSIITLSQRHLELAFRPLYEVVSDKGLGLVQ